MRILHLLQHAFPNQVIADVAPAYGGFSNLTVTATIGGEPWVIKAADRPVKRADLRREAAVLRALGQKAKGKRQKVKGERRKAKGKRQKEVPIYPPQPLLIDSDGAAPSHAAEDADRNRQSAIDNRQLVTGWTILAQRRLPGEPGLRLYEGPPAALGPAFFALGQALAELHRGRRGDRGTGGPGDRGPRGPGGNVPQRNRPLSPGERRARVPVSASAARGRVPRRAARARPRVSERSVRPCPPASDASAPLPTIAERAAATRAALAELPLEQELRQPLEDALMHPVWARGQGPGGRGQGAGARGQGPGGRGQGSEFRALGSGSRIVGSGFRVLGSGFWVLGPPSIIHGDAGLHNVLWHDGRVTLIDWELAGAGSPLIDLGWVAWTMRFRRLPGEHWAAFCAGYGGLPELTPDVRRAVALGQIAGLLLRAHGQPAAWEEWLRRLRWTLAGGADGPPA